ncbi:MAG TPA: MaoC/PaaZ C-terminal domain-containing protein [Candidatus Dormibacteraeota bacterium]|nr:MaoC/PaaZ C-terminal domain-containing protein [Candidatus Dormibacteraeota bacterium]
MSGPELRPGLELPELVKHPTTRQLVQYAGASGDFYEIHYDQEFARSAGLPGVVLHGLLKAAFLAQVVTSWAGERGRLTGLEVSYRGLDLPGRPLRCRGVVKAVEGERVELELWTEDPEGRRTTVGGATLELRGLGRDRPEEDEAWPPSSTT